MADEEKTKVERLNGVNFGVLKDADRRLNLYLPLGGKPKNVRR